MSEQDMDDLFSEIDDTEILENAQTEQSSDEQYHSDGDHESGQVDYYESDAGFCVSSYQSSMEDISIDYVDKLDELEILNNSSTFSPENYQAPESTDSYTEQPESVDNDQQISTSDFFQEKSILELTDPEEIDLLNPDAGLQNSLNNQLTSELEQPGIQDELENTVSNDLHSGNYLESILEKSFADILLDDDVLEIFNSIFSPDLEEIDSEIQNPTRELEILDRENNDHSLSQYNFLKEARIGSEDDQERIDELSPRGSLQDLLNQDRIGRSASISSQTIEIPKDPVSKKTDQVSSLSSTGYMTSTDSEEESDEPEKDEPEVEDEKDEDKKEDDKEEPVKYTRKKGKGIKKLVNKTVVKNTPSGQKLSQMLVGKKVEVLIDVTAEEEARKRSQLSKKTKNDKITKESGKYKEARSKYSGPPGLFGYPSSSSYFRSQGGLKRASKRGPMPGLFDHLGLKPPDFSSNGSKVEKSEETKDLDTERLLVDKKSEILTADGLIQADSLLSRTEEELKKLGPFFVIDENNEEIKFDILSAEIVIVTGKTKIAFERPADHNFHYSPDPNNTPQLEDWIRSILMRYDAFSSSFGGVITNRANEFFFLRSDTSINTQIDNVRLNRALIEVVIDLIDSSDTNFSAYTFDFITKYGHKYDIFKLDELFDDLIDSYNPISSTDLSFVKKISSNLNKIDTFLTYDVLHDIYTSYLEGIRNSMSYYFRFGDPALIDFHLKLNVIIDDIQSQIQKMRNEGSISNIVISKNRKGFLGELDLFMRRADVWVTNNIAKVLANNFEAWSTSLIVLGSKRIVPNGRGDLVEYFYDLFRDSSSLSPHDNGFDVAISILKQDLGIILSDKVLNCSTPTIKYISEFKYLKLKDLKTLIHRFSGISHQNGADFASKFGTIAHRLNSQFGHLSNPDEPNIRKHIEGWYDALDTAMFEAKLTRYKEVYSGIIQFKRHDGSIGFLNVPLNNQSLSANDMLQKFLHENLDGCSDIKLYPLGVGTIYSRTTPSGIIKYNINFFDDDLRLRYSLNTLNRNIKPGDYYRMVLNYDGTKSRIGILKSDDLIGKFSIYESSDGILRAWKSSELDSIKEIILQFRTISVSDAEFRSKSVICVHKVDGSPVVSSKVDLNNYYKDGYNLFNKPNFESYGYASDRNNIFKVIKKDNMGYYIVTSSNLKLYLSTLNEEDANLISRARLLGIINKNYFDLNPDNALSKDTSFLGTPDSNIDNYMRFAYSSDGSLYGNIFLFREDIQITAGSKQTTSLFLPELLNSFTGPFRLERYLMGDYLMKTVRELYGLNSTEAIEIDELSDFLVELRETFSQFTSSSDIRLRTSNVLLDDLERNILNTINELTKVRDGIKSHNIVDYFAANDFVGDKIDLRENGEFVKLKFSQYRKTEDSLPFELLWDHKHNLAYMDTPTGIVEFDLFSKDDGIISLNYKELASYIGYPDIQFIKVLKKSNSMSGHLKEMMEIYGLRQHLINLSDIPTDKLAENFDFILDIGRIANNMNDLSLNQVSKTSVGDSTNVSYKIVKGNPSNRSNPKGMRFLAASSYYEFELYMRRIQSIIEKYNHISLPSNSTEFVNIRGQKITIRNLKDLIEYSRIQMLKQLMLPSSASMSDNSMFTPAGHMLMYYHTYNHRLTMNLMKYHGEHSGNSLSKYIFATGDSTQHKLIINGSPLRGTIGPDSYWQKSFKPKFKNSEFPKNFNDIDLIWSIYHDIPGISSRSDALALFNRHMEEQYKSLLFITELDKSANNAFKSSKISSGTSTTDISLFLRMFDSTGKFRPKADFVNFYKIYSQLYSHSYPSLRNGVGGLFNYFIEKLINEYLKRDAHGSICDY